MKNAMTIAASCLLCLLGSAVNGLAQIPKGEGGGEAPLDPDPRITYQYGPNMRFGVSVLKDQAGKPVTKRLTYSANGESNSTVVRVDGKDSEFGGAAGKWVEKDVKLPADPVRRTRDGSRSTWDASGLRFTQTVELVASRQPLEVAPGVQKRLYDTCLVRYTIENTDTRPRRAGLRLQLDTLIGSNDGVPFAVPGVQGLVNTMRDFPTARDVPEFAQALEFPDLKKPGTVSHITFKVGPAVESPGRVSLTHWPGFNVVSWEVPVANMGSDSAVVMYWDERELQPGDTRTLGFAYGLETVTSSEGKLGISVSGTFEVGQPFTVTAYVSNPARNSALTLTLPDGLERVQGEASQQVPPLADNQRDGNSLLTWRVKALRKGQFPIQVQSSEGSKAGKTVTIADAAAPVDGLARGKVVFLLIQERQPSGPQQVGDEVVFRLDSDPNRLFSIALNEDAGVRAHQAMLDLLRDAFNRDRAVAVNYRTTPRSANAAFRVWVQRSPDPAAD